MYALVLRKVILYFELLNCTLCGGTPTQKFGVYFPLDLLKSPLC